jgi:hypothetical protein
MTRFSDDCTTIRGRSGVIRDVVSGGTIGVPISNERRRVSSGICCDVCRYLANGYVKVDLINPPEKFSYVRSNVGCMVTSVTSCSLLANVTSAAVIVLSVVRANAGFVVKYSPNSSIRSFNRSTAFVNSAISESVACSTSCFRPRERCVS